MTQGSCFIKILPVKRIYAKHSEKAARKHRENSRILPLYYRPNHTPNTNRNEGKNMNRQQARQFITENPEQYLERDKSGKGFICPICGSGSGEHGTGITSKDNKHFTCWAGCYTSCDIIDIIGLQYNLEDYNEKLNKAAELYGIELTAEPMQERTPKASKPKTEPGETETDYTAFYLEAQKNLSKTDYHTRRGISQATAEYFKLGYVEQWKHPKAQNAPPSPRLIIPTSKYSYIARDTRAELTEQQKKYAKSKAGNVHIFNLEALKTAAEPIFITEGEIDAMSIYEAGGIAIGLGGIANIKMFAEAAAEIPQAQPYIIALDNDTPGERASEELFNLLQAKGLISCRLAIYGKYKDANEALQANRELLAKGVEQAKEMALISPEAAHQAQYELQNQASSYIETMRRELEKELEQPEISTGFKNIDSIINGGLYPGLYFIGAISSLGKTTLALQIADNVAKQGQDVLIISLEMAKRELIAKSISRETAEYSLQAKGIIKALGRTTADIMNLKRQQGYYEAGQWTNYTEEKKQEIAAVVDTAYKRYAEYAPHIFIYEGIGDISTEAIRSRIEEHRAIYGKAPVLIVDYLQILQADSDRLSDKQKIDKGVVELKRISRDYKAPVIAISSVNRQSYLEPISMESFKESGGIEFSSDILIGLQYKGMDYQDDNGKREKEADRLSRISALNKEMREAAKSGLPQPIEAKILKNRNGNRGTAELLFYPMYNYFTERAKVDEQPKPKYTII